MKRFILTFIILLSSITIYSCKKEEIIDISNISFNDKSYVYDGKEKTIEIEGNLPENVSVSYRDNKRIEIGSVTAAATLKNTKNDTILKELYATLTILEPTIDLDNISYTDSIIPYDGQMHELLLTGNIPAGYEVKYYNNTLTNPGVTIAKAEIINYKGIVIKEYEASLTILEDNKIKFDYLNELKLDYTAVGYKNLVYNQDLDGNRLSLNDSGKEREFENGIFAHANSTIILDNIKGMGYETFTSYIGINKTGRVREGATLEFKIFVDNKLVYSSGKMTKSSSMQFVEIDIKGANRLTLYADSIDNNGLDHATYCEPKLTYRSNVGPKIVVSDIAIPSKYQLTSDNILEVFSAYDKTGTKLEEDISYSLTKINDELYKVKYYVINNGMINSKEVSLNILNEDRFIKKLTLEDLKKPFANYLYYGYWLLSTEGRKAYDLILNGLLNVSLEDSDKTTITFKLQDNDIYVYPSEATLIKKYMSYDESRVYFTYYWREGDNAGVSYTTKNGLIDTITFKLYNGSGGYYYNHNLDEIYQKGEDLVSSWLVDLKDDMTDFQALSIVQRKLQNSTSYANVNYADGFYGVFINKNAICSGYSKGLEYVCHRLGIKVLYDVGYAGAAHAWNRVMLDGNWYMNDATWGLSFEGEDYFASSGRYSYYNYAKMPKLVEKRYNANLTKYPLISILETNFLLVKGEEFDINKYLRIDSSVSNIVEITKIEGDLSLENSGTFIRKIKVFTNIGNTLEADLTFNVMNNKFSVLKENTTIPTNSETSFFDELYLWNGIAEEKFTGFKMKAISNKNATISIDVDNTKAFSVYFSIDKSIRDNVPWGSYANATVLFYIDDNLVSTYNNIGWKTPYKYETILIPEGSKKITIEVVGSSGQDRVAFGSPTLYN